MLASSGSRSCLTSIALLEADYAEQDSDLVVLSPAVRYKLRIISGLSFLAFLLVPQIEVMHLYNDSQARVLFLLLIPPIYLTISHSWDS